jgi:hypothetical protein
VLCGYLILLITTQFKFFKTLRSLNHQFLFFSRKTKIRITKTSHFNYFKTQRTCNFLQERTMDFCMVLSLLFLKETIWNMIGNIKIQRQKNPHNSCLWKSSMAPPSLIYKEEEMGLVGSILRYTLRLHWRNTW